MDLALVSIFDDEFSPPLGLMSIATYLQKHNYNIKIIDINYDNVVKEINNYDIDIIGFSSMTHHYKKAIDFANHFDDRLSSRVVFIGGVHISMLPSSLSPVFDYGIIGEGEHTILDILSQKKVSTIDGIAYADKGKIKTTKPRGRIRHLDSIPIPDRSLINKKYFKKRWISGELRKAIGTTMLTSRGCPYRCKFCSTSRFWGRVRFHSPERVHTEVKYLHEEFGVEHIQIWDDLFTQNIERLEKIADLLEKDDLNKEVSFHCHPRANLMSDELCKLLKRINVTTLNFGFESGSEKVLNYLKGGSVTVEDNKKAILLGKEHGFSVVGSLMFGSPGESIEDMEQTLKFIDFAKKNGADNLWHFVTTPFPGTPIWELAKDRGAVSNDMDWNLLKHTNINRPLLLDDDIDLEDFKKTFNRAKRKIYAMRLTRKNWLKSKILHDRGRLFSRIRCEFNN